MRCASSRQRPILGSKHIQAVRGMLESRQRHSIGPQLDGYRRQTDRGEPIEGFWIGWVVNRPISLGTLHAPVAQHTLRERNTTSGPAQDRHFEGGASTDRATDVLAELGVCQQDRAIDADMDHQISWADSGGPNRREAGPEAWASCARTDGGDHSSAHRTHKSLQIASYPCQRPVNAIRIVSNVVGVSRAVIAKTSRYVPGGRRSRVLC